MESHATTFRSQAGRGGDPQGVGEFICYVPDASEPEKLDNLQRIAEDILLQVAT